MYASPFDFVTALSAEERCPVCRELSAPVDQHLCAVCATSTCRDCGTAMARASRPQSIASARGDAHARSAGPSDGSASDSASAHVRSARALGIAGAEGSWVCTPCGRRAPTDRFVAERRGGSSRARDLWARLGALLGEAMRGLVQAAERCAGLLDRAPSRVAPVLRIRQHALALVIGTAILIALARAEPHGELR